MDSLPNPISAFSPTPAQAEFIIHSITSRDTTLAHIGAHCGVTVETLTCWLATPAIRARLESSDSTTCHAIRVRANVLTPLALAAAARIIDDYLIATSTTTPTHSPSTRVRSIDPELLALRRAETVRKAAALIVRLTSHQPAHTRRAASTSAPVADTPRSTATDTRDQQTHNEDTPSTIPESEIAPITSDQHPRSLPSAIAAQTENPPHHSIDPPPAPAAPTIPDSQDSTPVEHILDLIAALSPEQVAHLSTFGAPLNPNAQLATADSS